MVRRSLAALTALTAAMALAGPGLAVAAGYPVAGTCGGWPRAAVPAGPGHCVALGASAAQGLKFPRRLLAVAPNRFWLVDMGSWERFRGRLLELTLGDGATATLRVLAEGLDRPHGLARGPDGWVYVAEAGRLWRALPGAAFERQAVWDGLPADGAHPLKEIVFAPDGRLFINIGSFSDACRDDAGRQPRPCPEREGPRPRAAVWEARLDGPGRTVGTVSVQARGLRNSVPLAWEPRHGVLWQGENSIDYPDAGEPPEELNRLQPGADHGWPYCVGARRPARGYEGADCAATTAPARLWPAHAAPLAMAFVPGDSPSPWAGELLVAWHGHRAVGRRVVALPVDARGQPGASPRLVFGGVVAGFSPAPAGFTVTPEGRLLIADDRHKAVLMLLPEGR